MAVCFPGEKKPFRLAKFAIEQACYILGLTVRGIEIFSEEVIAAMFNDRLVTVFETLYPANNAIREGYVYGLVGHKRKLLSFRSVSHGKISDYELVELANKFVERRGPLIPVELTRSEIATEVWLIQRKPMIQKVRGLPFTPMLAIRNSEAGCNGVQIASVLTTHFGEGDEAPFFHRWDKTNRSSLHTHVGKKSTYKMQRALIDRAQALVSQTNLDSEYPFIEAAAHSPTPEGTDHGDALEYALIDGIGLLGEERHAHLRLATKLWGALG